MSENRKKHRKRNTRSHRSGRRRGRAYDGRYPVTLWALALGLFVVNFVPFYYQWSTQGYGHLNLALLIMALVPAVAGVITTYQWVRSRFGNPPKTSKRSLMK